MITTVPYFARRSGPLKPRDPTKPKVFIYILSRKDASILCSRLISCGACFRCERVEARELSEQHVVPLARVAVLKPYVYNRSVSITEGLSVKKFYTKETREKSNGNDAGSKTENVKEVP